MSKKNSPRPGDAGSNREELKPSDCKDILTIRANMCKKSYYYGTEICPRCEEKCAWGMEYIFRQKTRERKARRRRRGQETRLRQHRDTLPGEIPGYALWLRDYLMSQGMSQSQVSERAGYHRSRIHVACYQGSWPREFELRTMEALGLGESQVLRLMKKWEKENPANAGR
ncbi:MAG: helix-turn-helix transcriptional regulator [Oscillospiraceae bacterium]|nr:helix-turn-helix transcriptional regulator [Oscillospiraceae bacterium]